MDQARDLFPERVDADRQETYALYLNGQWQAWCGPCTAALAAYGQDPQTQLTVASAQFELGEYELAAEGFSKVKDLSVDNLRDYAVCLGRLGQIDQAEQVLESLSGKGAHRMSRHMCRGRSLSHGKIILRQRPPSCRRWSRAGHRP